MLVKGATEHQVDYVRPSDGQVIWMYKDIGVYRGFSFGYDRLISTMVYPILVSCHLYIESGPSSWKVILVSDMEYIRGVTKQVGKHAIVLVPVKQPLKKLDLNRTYDMSTTE